MAPELGLHRLYEQSAKFESGPERNAFESGIRTFAILVINDSTASVVSGLPGVFDDFVLAMASLSKDPGWWTNDVDGSRRSIESMDECSLRILHTILKPRRLCGFGVFSVAIPLAAVARSVSWFCNVAAGKSGSNADTDRVDHKLGSFISPTTTDPASRTDGSQPHDIMEEYKRIEVELEHWRASVPEERDLSLAKHSALRTDKNVVLTVTYLYVISIVLHRPFILEACLSIVSNKGCHEESKAAVGLGPSIVKDGSNAGMGQLQDDLGLFQMTLDKCIFAADEIVAIFKQLTDAGSD